MSLAAVSFSSDRQTAQGIGRVRALVWGGCFGKLGADHITITVERDMPPQCFVCGSMPQASHCYGMPLTAVVRHSFLGIINSILMEGLWGLSGTKKSGC